MLETIKNTLRLGHSATDTSPQHAYGDSVFSRDQGFRWFKALSEGRESTENEPGSGRCTTVSKQKFTI
ncbi:hypothetical protein NQ318_003325 [Aromia moschata]|uniref:Uncharacterized protein n=1 Tax=Aromia moschata TaxID=1265417 RepID=A0AAV8YMN2_9CUCU|nr:hypothetical protein NQ318_003325 [Aromia moschata]